MSKYLYFEEKQLYKCWRGLISKRKETNVKGPAHPSRNIECSTAHTHILIHDLLQTPDMHRFLLFCRSITALSLSIIEPVSIILASRLFLRRIICSLANRAEVRRSCPGHFSKSGTFMQPAHSATVGEMSRRRLDRDHRCRGAQKGAD